MGINGIDAGTSVLALSTKTYSATKSKSYGASSDIEDCYMESSDSTKFKEIANDYDLTDISGTELSELGQKLYNNGLISKDEANTINSASSDCPLRHLSIKKNSSGAEYVDENEMEHPELSKENYLQMWQEVQKDATQGSDLENTANKVLDVLDKIKHYSS